MDKLKNCKDCTFMKCLYRVDGDFKICPVEKKKQDLIENEKNI